jgi:hypothetical protein
MEEPEFYRAGRLIHKSSGLSALDDSRSWDWAICSDNISNNAT